MRLFDFAALSFDCYGTLIDWETGISAVLGPWARGHGHDIDDQRLLAAYGQHETRIEAQAPLSAASVATSCCTSRRVFSTSTFRLRRPGWQRYGSIAARVGLAGVPPRRRSLRSHRTGSSLQCGPLSRPVGRIALPATENVEVGSVWQCDLWSWQRFRPHHGRMAGELTSKPPEMTHRTAWLTAVRLIMRWDIAGSEIFVVGSLLGAAALGFTHGWQGVAWLLVPLIVAAAIWLALLGILIVVGLTVTMRSGVNPDDEFWQSIIAQPRILGG